MRIPTLTVDRDGVAVVINAKDFRHGIDTLYGDPAPKPAPPADPDATERAKLFSALADLNVRPGGRTSTEKLRAILVEAQAESAGPVEPPLES